MISPKQFASFDSGIHERQSVGTLWWCTRCCVILEPWIGRRHVLASTHECLCPCSPFEICGLHKQSQRQIMRLTQRKIPAQVVSL